MLKKILLGTLFILVLCAIGIVLFAKDFEVQISEKVAQDAINAQIKAGPVKKLGVKIELKNAEVDFQADNTMKISADFGTETLGYSHTVNGIFESGISYRSPRIYLDNISPVKVDVQTDDETKEDLDELKSAARKFLQRQKDKVKSEDNKAHLEKEIGKDSEAFQENIVKATYDFFELIPIYDLNTAGYKGSLASLALKDVRFSEDYATITLSPVRALIKILTMIGIFLLTVLWYGKWFIAGKLLNKVKTHKPLTISGYVDVPFADRADFALALPEHTRLTNQEIGCHYFRITPDPVIEGRYLVEEAFDDQAAYDLHAARTRKTKWAHVTRNIKRSYEIN